MSMITTSRERKNITQAVRAQGRQADQTLRPRRSAASTSASPLRAATSLKYTDPHTHQRGTIRLGVYHREMFNVDHARTKAMAMKARIGNGEDIAQAPRQTKQLQAKLSASPSIRSSTSASSG